MKYASTALIGVAVFIVACGGPGRRSIDLTPKPSSEVLKNVPKWFSSVPKDDNILFAAATSTSSDLQLAINKAQTEGRNQLAQQVEIKFNGLQKRFQEETGLANDSEYLDQFTSAYKSIVSTELYGSRISKQETQQEGRIFRTYVFMEMPIGEASQQLIAKLKANQNLYTRFRASEAYKELDQEIEKYEQWKKGQGNP
ncbi:MAG: LPP20 family lipoprotein [candidate division Zixibacteria bacterium]|nr:LPP20 family lipoprotein [candidate division Zixibacteria bacterium]